METCPGCEWCQTLRLPDFEDDDALMDFLDRHPDVPFEGVRPVPPRPLSPRARALALEAAQRVAAARQPGQTQPEAARTGASELVSVFARAMLGAAL